MAERVAHLMAFPRGRRMACPPAGPAFEPFWPAFEPFWLACAPFWLAG